MRTLFSAAAIALAWLSDPGQLRATSACQIDLKAALTLGFANGLATVETKINGLPATLGIDTGAQTFVTPEAVRTFSLGRDWRRTRAVGTTTVLIANNVILRDFEFAGQHYRGKSVASISLPAEKNAQASVKGLLGTDILADYDLDFDFPNRKLYVYKVVNCKTVSPPGFTVASSIPFKFNRQRGAVLSVELDKTKLTAIVDTGAASHAITRAAATRMKINALTLNTDLSVDANGIGDVVVKRSFHQFRSLSVGGETIVAPLLGIVDTPIAIGDILLGQPFLFSRRFFISNSTHTLLLEKEPAPAFTYTPSTVVRLPSSGDEEACKAYPVLQRVGKCGQSPATARPGNGYLGLRTGFLSEGCLRALGSSAPSGVIAKQFPPVSPARAAGILPGDILISLNGAPIENGTAFIASIRNLPSGGVVTIKVLRRKSELSLDAVLEDAAIHGRDKRDLAGQIDETVRVEKATLDVLPEAGCPVERALSEAYLGNSLNASGRATPDDKELGLQYMERGLAALDPKTFAVDWGRSQINLARAYRTRTAGDMILNNQKAIEGFSRAIAIDALPRSDRGRAFAGRAVAYMNKTTGPIADNIEQSISDLTSAAQTFDEKESPRDWADMHRALATAYLRRAGGDKSKNLEEAIKALEIASAAYETQNLATERNGVLAKLDELKKERAKAQSFN